MLLAGDEIWLEQLDSILLFIIPKITWKIQYSYSFLTWHQQYIIIRFIFKSLFHRLKFSPGGSPLDWFISSDMFYLEVMLESSGGVKDVRIHHEGKVEQQVSNLIAFFMDSVEYWVVFIHPLCPSGIQQTVIRNIIHFKLSLHCRRCILFIAEFCNVIKCIVNVFSTWMDLNCWNYSSFYIVYCIL